MYRSLLFEVGVGGVVVGDGSHSGASVSVVGRARWLWRSESEATVAATPESESSLATRVTPGPPGECESFFKAMLKLHQSESSFEFLVRRQKDKLRKGYW